TVAAFAWPSINAATETWALGALLCLIFFCNDLAMGPAWASCADVGERLAGTLGGTMNMVGNLTGAIGNLVLGYLFDAGRPGLVFIIYGISFGCASLCWLALDVTRPIQDEP